MKQKSNVYHILKATEGGAGQKWKMMDLKAAGIKCSPTTSYYVGHTAIIVYGNARVQKRAERICFG